MFVFVSGRVPTVAANRILLKNISLVGVLWGGYLQAHPEYSAAVHAALMQMYRAGQLRPAVGTTCPFDQAPRDLRDLADRQVVVQSVLTISACGLGSI